MDRIRSLATWIRNFTIFILTVEKYMFNGHFESIAEYVCIHLYGNLTTKPAHREDFSTANATERVIYYRKSVTHLPKHMFHVHSRYSTDLRQYTVPPVY